MTSILSADFIGLAQGVTKIVYQNSIIGIDQWLTNVE